MGVTPPRVMTIAGTDSSGGAGIAADLRTFAACGVHGCCAVTAVTVQNSLGVSAVHPIPAATVAAQIESVITDIGLDALKTGMLANASIIEAIVALCHRFGIGGDGPIPLVVDPVAASAGGEQLLADAALEAIRTRLAPRASLITPNLDEVRLLVGIDVHDREAQYEAARRLHTSDRGSSWSRAATCGRTLTTASTCCTTGTRSANYLAPGSTPTTLTVLATAWERPSRQGWRGR